MKTIKRILLPAVVALSLWLGACTPSMTFQTSTVVPSATGKAHIKRDRNDNYIIKVNVRNLAPADRLTPPERTYIVWAELGRSNVRKLGLLEPRSKALEASLTATTVESPDRIFITAERSPDLDYPSGPEVLVTARR